MRCLTLLGLALTTPLAAQTTQPLAQAAWSITAVDVARRIGIIADDSMMGRDTPSRGLELTAEYVADQFRRFGLKTSLQRYPVTRRRLDPVHSRVVFSVGARKETASFTTAVRYEGGSVPQQPVWAAPYWWVERTPPSLSGGLTYAIRPSCSCLQPGPSPRLCSRCYASCSWQGRRQS